jgi:two-component system chemotaxis response regulator CheY
VAKLVEIGVLGEPFEASNAAEALAILTRDRVDFAVVSWTVSGMTGPKLVERIRADSDLRRLHVLLVASEAKRDNALVAAAAGANDYILRPFGADALEKKIVRIATLARMLSHQTVPASIAPPALVGHPVITAEQRVC